MIITMSRMYVYLGSSARSRPHIMVKILSVTRQSELIRALSPSTPVLWS